MGKGGHNNICVKNGGGGGGEGVCAIACLLGGSRGMLSHKIVEFIPSEVHFQTHLWFSNDMMRWPDFWC